MGKFVIKSTNTGIRFDLKAANGEIIATSEEYTTKAACQNGIESVRHTAPDAGIDDKTVDSIKPIKHPKFEIYSDNDGCYRFRLKARNGEIIAFSEGYVAKASCINGIESVKRNSNSVIINTIE